MSNSRNLGYTRKGSGDWISRKEAEDSKKLCVWNSKAGASFDLRALTLSQSSTTAYEIVDGDIPCTPEIEPSYGYTWNFCSTVPSAAIPEECGLMGKNGVVLQHARFSETEYYCYIVGHYDPAHHELTYNLLDVTDPSKGVSVRYPAGERCSTTNTKTRSATIDVQCANTPSVIVSAQEPEECEYHLVMKSYRGCPKECPVTSSGLCSSHGHCAYDRKKQKAYCYCNDGYSGSDCSTKTSSSQSYDGFSVQLGLLITLLVIALGLTGGVVYLSLRIAEFRKHQIASHYSSLPGGESEMVETVTFR
eukprot:scaffold3161_cov247-Ochromonas_danica.AAC.12